MVGMVELMVISGVGSIELIVVYVTFRKWGTTPLTGGLFGVQLTWLIWAIDLLIWESELLVTPGTNLTCVGLGPNVGLE